MGIYCNFFPKNCPKMGDFFQKVPFFSSQTSNLRDIFCAKWSSSVIMLHFVLVTAGVAFWTLWSSFFHSKLLRSKKYEEMYQFNESQTNHRCHLYCPEAFTSVSIQGVNCLWKFPEGSRPFQQNLLQVTNGIKTVEELTVAGHNPKQTMSLLFTASQQSVVQLVLQLLLFLEVYIVTCHVWVTLLL